MYLRKRGNFYHIVYRSNGKKSSITTKETNIRKARLKLKQFELACHTDPESAKINRITFREFTKYYLNYSLYHHSERYYESIDFTLSEFEKFLGRNYYLTEITKQKISKYLSIKLKGKRIYAHNLALRILRSAFNWAIWQKYLLYNPTKDLKQIKTTINHPGYISVTTFLEIISFCSDLYLKIIFQILYRTGMRISELLNLRWGNIDFENKFIHIISNKTYKTKNRKSRKIAMTENLLFFFKKLKEFSPYHYDDSKVIILSYQDRRKISKRFKNCVFKSGANSKYRLHDLRHSFCSNLLLANVPIHVVQHLAGHSDIRTTAIYLHVLDDDLKEASRKLEEKFNKELRIFATG